MQDFWTDQKLGQFEYDGEKWTKSVPLPAFDAFDYYIPKSAKGGQNNREYEIVLEVDENERFPSQGAVALALRVIENQSNLVATITEALWEEFNGHGPDSGMWWHGGLDQVSVEPLNGREIEIKQASDIVPLMTLTTIRIGKVSDEDPTLIADMIFDAHFEQEHGVSVLTDGNVILGTGYCGDAHRFES